jgi:hypothetical protein
MPAVAEIYTDGLIHALATGTSVISATYGTANGSYQLTVTTLDQSGWNTVLADVNIAVSSAASKISSTLYGHYSQDSVNALQAAISSNTAKVAAALAQQEVNDAAAALSDALQVFKLSVHTNHTLADLALMGMIYGARRDNSSNWSSIEMYDLNRDGKLDIADIAGFAWDLK